MNIRSTWRIIPLLILLTSCDLDFDDLVSKRKDITPNDFLSAENYTSLEIEVVYVDGFQPSSKSLANLKAMLEARLNKPDGISIATKSIQPPGVDSYTVDKLKDIEKTHRGKKALGTSLTSFIFFADKPYAGGSSAARVLGLYYDNTSLAVFEKTVHDRSGGVGQPGGVVLETWVLNHEYGHAMGLVNNGSSMQSSHEHNERKGHCDNDACIMHFESDARLLSGVPEFDENCLADLRANGGK